MRRAESRFYLFWLVRSVIEYIHLFFLFFLGREMDVSRPCVITLDIVMHSGGLGRGPGVHERDGCSRGGERAVGVHLAVGPVVLAMGDEECRQCWMKSQRLTKFC